MTLDRRGADTWSGPMVVVVYLLVCIAPVLAFALMDRALRWFAFAPGRRRRRTARTPLGRAERSRYSHDLRRLGLEHDRLLLTDQPAKAARLRAIELAYDDTLRKACEALALEPLPRPLDGPARVQAEAELVVHGLTW